MTTAQKKCHEYSAAFDGERYVLLRDGQPMQTPRNLPLTVDKKEVADALLAECAGQGDRFDLRQMPIMQMVLTVIDIAPSQRGNIINGIMRHADSELTCQRATDPADLVDLQNNVWQAYGKWAERQFKIRLETGNGIVPFSQSAETLAVFRQIAEGLDDARLVGLSEAVGLSGSLVLGLALAMQHSSVDEVFAAAELDQLWQMKKWGDDPAVLARHQDIKRELDVCRKWFDLVGKV